MEPVDIDILDFERWLSDFSEIRRHYENMSDVFIEKSPEHYFSFRYLNISAGDVYIDIASSGSPWAGILNKRGVEAYRLDLSFPKGIKGTDIGSDAGDTKLPDDFASVLSLQCAYECFMVMRDSPLSGQKTGSFKVHSVPALNDFIFSI